MSVFWLKRKEKALFAFFSWKAEPQKNLLINTKHLNKFAWCSLRNFYGTMCHEKERGAVATSRIIEIYKISPKS